MNVHSRRDRAQAPSVDLCLARSTLYRALTLAFRPPTGESLGQLTGPEGAGAIRAAATLLDASGAGGEAIHPAAARLAAYGPGDVGQLRERYEWLFGHTARGKVPPFETGYGVDGLFRGPQELADVSGFYLAFGLRPRPDAGERVDHVGCECEFLDFLCRKEAYALEAGEQEMAEHTRRAYRDFLRHHLGRFGRAFAGRLQAADQEGFYGALGSLLDALLRFDAVRLGVSVGPQVLELRSEAPDPSPMACGTDGGAECAECP